MDAAVDAVFSRAPREGAAAVPHRMSNEAHRAGAIRLSAEGLACTKAVCNYIYETYGRFPGATDAMHLMWVMQAHHIDTDYYDRFFGRRRLWPAARRAYGDLASVRAGKRAAPLTISWRIDVRSTLTLAPARAKLASNRFATEVHHAPRRGQ